MTEYNDEIFAKNIFSKIYIVYNYLISKYIFIIIAIIIGGTIGYIYAKSVRPVYTSSLTFVLSTESKNSGFAGLASQFGLDMGTNNGGDVFSGDNILTLFQSKKMIKGVLFKKIENNPSILVNIVVKEWEWDRKWKGIKNLSNLFPFPNDLSLLNPTQDSLINEVYLQIINKNLIVSRVDKKLSVYKLSTISTNELFGFYLTKYLMDETADFYIATKTRIAKNNLRMLQNEADSLRRLLGSNIISTASEVDRTFNLNPALQVQRSSIQKGQLNTNVIGTAYGEVVKNLELAKINLERETPLYQIIDTPELPLKAERSSKLKGLLLGALIAFTFLISILIFKLFFKKI